MSQPLGVHASIAGGIDRAISRGEAVGCTALQIFTKNASRWAASPLAEEAAAAFRRAWKASRIGPVYVHDSYLINLAAPDEEKWRKSQAAFLDEMRRCSALGVPGLVMHPGAHLGAGEEAGLRRIAVALRAVLAEAPPDVQILLETTAGMGSHLGWRFEQLARIMDLVPEHAFGVCFDTCHVFAAGYDLSDEAGYATVMDEFDRLIGCQRIRLFHLNDSKKPCGSRLDRHEHVGRGCIGETGFTCLMRDERFAGVAKIIETPPGEDHADDLRNLALLRRLAGES
ncbi:endonuclease IV [Geothermobacter ehrlichii]|uniref:Probable endonuclease 4 n=1 Tax=Geothermobacter ehrlichii TaxID=213224 RepID=A0A5D3WLI9_9BACT|nr:deoxyribonuclease IV [Geothermobacter ehrlichii]TYO99307.1 endonuclease IV [Geothermobacter ehrlichii]